MKKILVILFLIMFVITIFQITTLYARYRTELQDTYEETIGKWVVKVNESDIFSGSEIKIIDIEKYLVYEKSALVEGGIAPGSTGYFDLIIDPRDLELGETDVSIKYTLEVTKPSKTIYLGITEVENFFYKNDKDFNEITNLTSTASSDADFYEEENSLVKLVTIEKNESEPDALDEGLVSDFYVGVFPLNMIREGHKNVVRVHFICVNEDILDIEEINNVEADVNLTLEQYKGEELSL